MFRVYFETKNGSLASIETREAVLRVFEGKEELVISIEEEDKVLAIGYVLDNSFRYYDAEYEMAAIPLGYIKTILRL